MLIGLDLKAKSKHATVLSSNLFTRFSLIRTERWWRRKCFRVGKQRQTYMLIYISYCAPHLYFLDNITLLTSAIVPDREISRLLTLSQSSSLQISNYLKGCPKSFFGLISANTDINPENSEKYHTNLITGRGSCSHSLATLVSSDWWWYTYS